MNFAGLSHLGPKKLILRRYEENRITENKSKGTLEGSYDTPLDLRKCGSSSTQCFQPEDLAGITETPQGHAHSSKQTNEKASENSCSVLRKDACASKSIAKWECGKCPKWFKKESALMVHLQNDCYDPKPYKCDKCPVECESVSKLARHEMIHTGEKPYKCDHCWYTCNRKQLLKNHTERFHGK